jgi:hypothetical protein
MNLQSQLSQPSRRASGTAMAARAPPIETIRHPTAYVSKPVNIPQPSSAPNSYTTRDYPDPVNSSFPARGASSGSPRRFPVNDTVPLAQQMSEELGQRYNLNELRRMPQLNAQVDGLMSNLALLEPEKDYDFLASTSASADPRAGKPTALRSGRVAKNCDIVLLSLLWPHTSLKFSYASRDIKFEELDIALLVAGELEIQANPSIQPSEKLHRLNLLQSIMYFSKRYVWSNCLDYFGAILAHVERGGLFSDSEALAVIQQNTLNSVKKPLPISSSTPSPSTNTITYPTQHMPVPQPAATQSRPWFCKPFQNGSCQLAEPHDQIYHGSSIRVMHICAFCSLYRKTVAKHPEKDCPHAVKKPFSEPPRLVDPLAFP